MEITEVRIYPANEEKLRGFATITVDNCFAIHDVKLLEGQAGLFVSMPSKKLKDGTFKHIVYPKSAETRTMIERTVIAEYKKVMAAHNPAR